MTSFLEWVFTESQNKQQLYRYKKTTYEKLYELKTPIEIGPEILKNFENYVKNHHLEYYLDGELA